MTYQGGTGQWQGHGPGCACYRCRQLAGQQQRPEWVIWAVVIAAALVFVWAALHVITAEVSKSSPPVACQLLGGTWNFWDGWVCQ